MMRVARRFVTNSAGNNPSNSGGMMKPLVLTGLVGAGAYGAYYYYNQHPDKVNANINKNVEAGKEQYHKMQAKTSTNAVDEALHKKDELASKMNKNNMHK